MAYGIQNVGRGKPVKTGPGGFVPMSAGMSLPQLYGALAAQERYGALIDSAYKDWLRSAPATSVSLMRGGSTPQQAQGASQTRLTGPAPSYGTDGAGKRWLRTVSSRTHRTRCSTNSRCCSPRRRSPR